MAKPIVASVGDVDQSITQNYDAEHLAPVVAARVQLTTPNSRSHYRLQSRPNAQAAWRTMAEDEAFNLLTPAGERRNPQLTLPLNHDRYWRLLGDAGSAPIAASLRPSSSTIGMNWPATRYSPRTSAAVSRRPVMTSTFGSWSSCVRR